MTRSLSGYSVLIGTLKRNFSFCYCFIGVRLSQHSLIFKDPILSENTHGHTSLLHLVMYNPNPPPSGWPACKIPEHSFKSFLSLAFSTPKIVPAFLKTKFFRSFWYTKKCTSIFKDQFSLWDMWYKFYRTSWIYECSSKLSSEFLLFVKHNF